MSHYPIHRGCSSNMENLPSDVHLDIFSRLPAVSLLRIKCVCKAWHALAQDPRLVGMVSARASKRNPSLILHCDSPLLNKLCYITSEEGYHDNGFYSSKALKVVPPFKSKMSEYQVVGSCNGLVCISDALYFNPTYVCNIFTGGYIELPKTSYCVGMEVALGFGNHPATKEYKIVRVVYYVNNPRYQYSDVQIFTVGTNAWRKLGPVNWRLDVRPSEAFLNGALHWVTKRNGSQDGPQVRIIAFDLAEEKFKEIELPTHGSLIGSDFHLVTLRDCLSAVVRKDETIEIWVMQVYNVNLSWTKDHVIAASSFPASIPVCLNQDLRLELRIWRSRTLRKGGTEVICMLKNGDILFSYEDRALVLYSPRNESLKEVVLSGLPRWFSVITHFETLLSVEEVLAR